MTTTITIKHEGPDHHDVLIDFVDKKTGKKAVSNMSVRLEPGKSHSQSMWDTSPLIVISEVEKLPVVETSNT